MTEPLGTFVRHACGPMDSLDSVARTIVQTSLDTRSGENVLIHGWEHTIDLMSKLAWQCRERGCGVMLSVQPEDLWLRSVMDSPMNLITSPADSLVAALKESQAFVFTLGPRSPIPWKRIPANRRGEVSVWLDTRYDRSRFAKEWARVAIKHSVRMLGIEATLATPERAKALGLDFRRWWQVMISGSTVDWKAVSKRARMLRPLLAGREKVHLTSRAGTELEFSLDKRRVSYSDGLTSEEKTRNGIVTFLPSGGIEVSIDEESARGRVVYDLPIRSPSGVVRNLELRVKDGRVREFNASEGRHIFGEYIRNHSGAEKLSFFGLGLNPNLSYGFTQDDKVLGGVTLGLGDNEKAGGRNRANGKEWWGVISNASLTIGNAILMHEGRFLSIVQSAHKS